MTNNASKAVNQTKALRKYSELPQAKLAEQKILKNLDLADLTSVVTALELDSAQVVNRD